MTSKTGRATALLTAVALVGGGYAIGTSGDGSAGAASSTTTPNRTADANRGPGRGGPHGPNLAALASRLGVTQARLRTALNSIRPVGGPRPGARPPGPPPPGFRPGHRPPGGPGGPRGGHETADGTALATALGTDRAKTIAAVRKAEAAEHAAGRRGPQEDTAAQAKIIAAELDVDVDEAKVKAALDKLEAAHRARHEQRETRFATALAKALNLDVDKVKAALRATRPPPPRG